MDNANRLERLKQFQKQLDAGFKAQEDCVTWAAQVAPLLNFNEYYYSSFVDSARYMNVTGLSGFTLTPHLNNMKSMLLQAITELEHGLTPERTVKTVETEYPEKITLKWLFSHVPVSTWLWAGGIVVVAFVAGVALGSSEYYQTTIKPLITAIKG